MDDFSDRWVRIMAEYSSDGVWDSEGCGCSVNDLPLSDGLRAAILAWVAWYDDNHDYDDGSDRPVFPLAEFSAHGRALARRVKDELPDWTVIYFDEEQAAQASWGGDRSAYEYEIKAGDET